MKFQVPQFIGTETKIIGPFTLKQFLFVAGAFAMGTMEYILLSGMWFLLALVPTVAFFGALAFVKIDGQPFLNYLAYMLSYALGAKRYIYTPPEEEIRGPLSGITGNG